MGITNRRSLVILCADYNPIFIQFGPQTILRPVSHIMHVSQENDTDVSSKHTAEYRIFDGLIGSQNV